MLTMGGDFQYENARINYKNIDKLIKYVNSATVRCVWIWLVNQFAGIHDILWLIFLCNISEYNG